MENRKWKTNEINDEKFTSVQIAENKFDFVVVERIKWE